MLATWGSSPPAHTLTRLVAVNAHTTYHDDASNDTTSSPPGIRTRALAAVTASLSPIAVPCSRPRFPNPLSPHAYITPVSVDVSTNAYDAA